MRLLVALSLTLVACSPADPADPADPTDTDLPDLRAGFERPTLTVHTRPTARCPADGLPALDGLRAWWPEEGDGANIAIELTGDHCGHPLTGFGFEVYDAEGEGVYSRSWPEVQAVERAGERFVLHGLAASCGDQSRGVTVTILVRGEGDSWARISADIEAAEP